MQQYEQFFKDNFKAIFRYFYYKGCTKVVAEDLTSETFFRLIYNHKETFNQMILWGIAKNIYKEHIRELIKRNETSNFDESDLVEKEEYYNENFDKKIEAMKLELYELIESLNENVKKVIKLRFIEGLTIKAIADQEGMPISTVKKYQKRGIDYLISKHNAISVYPLSFIL